jgi:DNA polymerase-3 subunit epsilon
MREIAFDTETTGLDPKYGHRVVEIGCVEMINRVATGKVFHKYINPERDVPEDAQAIHGITTEFLADKPIFADVAREFLEFIGDADLVAHNAGFDMKFINFQLEALGLKPISGTRVVDTLATARKMFPGSPASLDALCKRFNIDLGARTKHGALLDAELLANVYLEMTGGRQSSMILDDSASKALGGEVEMEIIRVEFAQRTFPVTTEERAAHNEFVNGLKNAVWQKYMDQGSGVVG